MSDDATSLEALTLELLRIESVIGNERALADWVEAWARERGMHEVVRAGDNLALVPRPLREGVPRVMLLGHLDTVPRSDENTPRLDDERIYGLGATDMKAADAVILQLLEHAVGHEPDHDLIGVLYAREEGPFDESGMPEIVEAAQALFDGTDLAIAMEPTDNAIELGCLGTMHAKVRFHGQRAHSARPWQGKNAIHMAAPFLSALAALEPRDCEYDGLLFREVCSATMVEYEGARNVIPGGFTINVNFRFAPDRSRSEAVAWLTTLVHDSMGAAAIETGAVTIEITDLCPSGRVVTDNPLLASLEDAAGGAVETRAKQAWTDVGRLSELGIDAMNFGPGSGAQAHQVGEWCLRSQLADSWAILHRWLFP
ncbi:MAG: succinyl-diaminopimelate desuccinylase [Planctomycetota bacterium]|nr:succinyl-diaminopimelate desuccinylase [Planctomycetota bacterium]